MGKTNNHYTGALLEDIKHRLMLVQESLYDLKEIRADNKQIKADLAEMKEWRSLADLLLRDYSKTLNNHEGRVAQLEAA